MQPRTQVHNPKLLLEVAKLGEKDPKHFPDAYAYYQASSEGMTRRRANQVYMTLATAAYKAGAFTEVLSLLDERSQVRVRGL